LKASVVPDAEDETERQVVLSAEEGREGEEGGGGGGCILTGST